MRRELLTTPYLLAERIAEGLRRRHRLRRLRGTPAQGLALAHIDSLELLETARQTTEPRVIYDVGANRGTWSLLARAICPAAEVHAFEPLAALHDEFRSRTRAVGRCTLHGVALGHERRAAPMFVHKFADASSLLPLAPAEARRWPDHLGEVREVPVYALDEYVRDEALPSPDLIKLDVQGYELQVLRGASEALARATAVIAEVSFEEFYEGQALFADVACYLGARGYRVFRFGYGVQATAPLTQADVLFLRR